MNQNKIILALVAIILLAVAVRLLFSKPIFNSTSDSPVKNSEETISPTSIPFADMTIPYLRERKYESALGEKSEFADYDQYTSYLTSYISDGFKINGLLTIPSSTMPVGGWPAIVFVHGYIPPTQYQTAERYVAYVDALARNGFVVFKIDLRGHGNSEGEATGAYYSSEYVVDVLNAKSALSKMDDVNPKNIGVWGHSMAGNVSMRVLAVDPTTKATVIWAGAVFSYEDMQKYGLSDNSYRPPTQLTQRTNRRSEMFRVHGQFDPKNDFWKQVVPLNYISEPVGAVQLHHSVNDDVVNINYSRDLAKSLKSKNVGFEIFEYESGGHNIDGSSFDIAMQRTTEFFQKNLR